MKKMFLADFTLGGILLIGILFSSLTATHGDLPCASACKTKCKAEKPKAPVQVENEPFRFDGFYYKL